MAKIMNKTTKREIKRGKPKMKVYNKNKMLMSFDEYYEKNVSKEDKREIEFEVELIEVTRMVYNNERF